jgi:CheY-like chemotaxis protein
MDILPNSILIVEDNDSICKLFSFLLKKAGYNPTIFTTGKECCNWINNNLPIIVLCDISLPDMSGVDVLEHIKKLKHTEKLSVIAVTAIARSGDKEKYLKLGFDGYIPKPINTTTFVSEIQKYIKP